MQLSNKQNYFNNAVRVASEETNLILDNNHIYFKTACHKRGVPMFGKPVMFHFGSSATS